MGQAADVRQRRNRESMLRDARERNRVFDVLVIGGGITGAGVARDAAMRGLSVILLEKGDFASGTSSRSSRLIHGGIRYLEHGQLRMVLESSRERATLLRIAPHIVKPLEFTWPVYQGDRVPLWKLRAGLTLYDRLARYPRLYRHQILDIRGVRDNEPELATQRLAGGAAYFDASADDARLTLANVVSASEHGALVLSYVQADEPRSGKPYLVVAHDVLGGAPDKFELRAHVIVDARGPWSTNSRVRRSKGTHIALPRDRIRNSRAITLLSRVDGRVMFVLPAGQMTIVGTTDTWTTEAPDEVRADRADIEYLLRSIRPYFPDEYFSGDDVVAAWAGIRPLARNAADANPVAVSREHRIVRDKSGVIRVAGGKLTTYRAMAAQIVDHVERAMRRRMSQTHTADGLLPGADRSEIVKAMETENSEFAAPMIPGLRYTRAEAVYTMRRELAVTIGDILIRRTRAAFETRDNARSAAPIVADLMARELGWSDQLKQRELERYEREIQRIFSVRE